MTAFENRRMLLFIVKKGRVMRFAIALGLTTFNLMACGENDKFHVAVFDSVEASEYRLTGTLANLHLIRQRRPLG